MSQVNWSQQVLTWINKVKINHTSNIQSQTKLISDRARLKLNEIDILSLHVDSELYEICRLLRDILVVYKKLAESKFKFTTTYHFQQYTLYLSIRNSDIKIRSCNRKSTF